MLFHTKRMNKCICFYLELIFYNSLLDPREAETISPLNIVAARLALLAISSAEQDASTKTMLALSPTFGQIFSPSGLSGVLPPFRLRSSC